MIKNSLGSTSANTSFLVVALMLVLALSLSACAAPPAPMAGAPASSGAEATDAPARTRLVVAGPFLTEILDAQQSWDGGFMTVEQIGQPLIRIDQESGELIPDLAEDWSFSDDTTSMFFTLPSDAVYANGDPVDAQAVADAWLRNKEVSPYASDFEALIDVKVVDTNRVEAIFTDPPAAFMTVLNSSFGGAWNASHAQEIGNEAFAIAPVSSGPFMVQEFTPGSEVLLVRNDNYQTNLPIVENRGPVHLTELLVRQVSEDMTLAAELETGAVDMLVPAPASAIDRLRANPDIVIYESLRPGAVNLVMNLTHPLFSDLRVRQAVAHAVNRDDLIKVLPGASAIHAFITPGMVAYSPEIEEYGSSLYPHDVAGAKTLLSDAGWSDSDGNGVVEHESEVFSAEILVSTTDLAQQQAAQVLQSQLKEIGIDLQIVQLENGALREAAMAGDYAITFDSYGWPDPDILSLVFGAPWWNVAKYDNPDAVERLVAARYILDPTERTAAYAEVQRELLDDVVEIPLWQNTTYVAARSYVQGLVFNGVHILLNDVTIAE